MIYSWKQLDSSVTEQGSGEEDVTGIAGSLLVFNPLNVSSGGMYQCTVSAQLADSDYLFNLSQVTNFTVKCKYIEQSHVGCGCDLPIT